MPSPGASGALTKLLLAGALIGCTPSEPAATAAPGPRPLTSTAASTPARGEPELRPSQAQTIVTSPTPRTTTHAALLDVASLQRLESQGFSLGEVVSGTAASSTAALNRLSAFNSIFSVLRKDVLRTAQGYPMARVTSVNGFRLFDHRWLDSDEMSFHLSGVFNRLDRRSFYPETCGEVRFLYRLGYATQQGGAAMASRLPMTVNVVFLVDQQSDVECQPFAAAWQTPEGLSDTEQLSWLLEHGALSDALRSRYELESVETNQQTLRLQSTVHTTLAGHIEYGMHVFQPTSDGQLLPAAMENMPDIAALERNRALRDELLAYLKQAETLQAIDQGTLKLPERFLATHATSVSPRGMSRLGNRPFRTLFTLDDFNDLKLAGYRTIASPRALLRRLDGASCTGCHQSRSIAGFHHIGHDAPTAPGWNSLLSGASSHLLAELERRSEYTARVAAGIAPDEFRPVPERQGVGNGYGAPCGLGDAGFADWTCAAGTHCVALEDDEVGACFAEPGIGSPCEYGVMRSKPAPRRDAVSRMAKHECAAQQVCDPNISGFPLGSCASTCTFDVPGGTCGDFLDVDGFQNCLRGKRPFDACASQFVFRTGLRACDRGHPCRQDYVCVRTQDATHGADAGACMPPYFVYQLRLDGYPLPR